MQVFNNIELQVSPACIAVGCFDGIHIGHQKIIREMCGYAEEKGLTPTVFTFNSSPAAFLSNSSPRALITQNEKMSIFENLGVEKCFSLDFSSIRNVSAEEYVQNILYKQLKARAVFCGFNYRFGKNALGNSDYLKELCTKLGIKAYVCSPICYGKTVVSSSKIRSLIEEGEICTANNLLGKPFSLQNVIVEGNHNGRTIGIPTINQNLPAEFVTPRFGAYASFAYIDGTRYNAVTNVGTRPTVNGTNINAETHILNGFKSNLYGKEIRTELLYFVRDEKKFNNLNELSLQIKQDIAFIEEHKIYQQYS